MQAAAREARRANGELDSDDDGGDGDGFGAGAAVRPLQPQVTVADNVSPHDLSWTDDFDSKGSRGLSFLGCSRSLDY